MSAPFVTNLRSRPSTIHLAPEGTNAITIRVEMAEVWDVVRISAAPNTVVRDLKVAALGALLPEEQMPADFMLKFRGWEILDEYASLADAGVVDGSILLLTYKRRRPVR
jgi:hypothetical protein